MNQGTYVRIRTKVLLSDYAEQWKGDQLHHRATSREQVEARMKLHIGPTLGNMALDSVRREDVQAAVGDWAESLAPSTVKVTHGYLTATFKAAVLDRKVQKTPRLSIRLPKIEPDAVVPFRTDTMQRLAAEIWRPYRPMAVFCAAAGRRSSELRGHT